MFWPGTGSGSQTFPGRMETLPTPQGPEGRLLGARGSESARGQGNARGSPPAPDGRFEILFFSSGETRFNPQLFSYLRGWTNTTKTFNQTHETGLLFMALLLAGPEAGREAGRGGGGPCGSGVWGPQDSASHRNPVHTPCRPEPCLPGAACWGTELRDRVKRLWLQLGL